LEVVLVEMVALGGNLVTEREAAEEPISHSPDELYAMHAPVVCGEVHGGIRNYVTGEMGLEQRR
jgi:hypothetical protein